MLEGAPDGASQRSEGARVAHDHEDPVQRLIGSKRLLQRRDVGIFLNIHKECSVQPTAEHLERGPRPITWRNPKLLNARALILSEPCYWRDEADYAGLIDFVPIGRIAATFEALMRTSAEERFALASARHACFRERFHPRAVFARAGVDAMLAERGSGKRGRGSLS